MKDIEIIEYYIFADKSDVKLGKYKTLEDLTNNAKSYLNDVDNDVYAGIGAEFYILEDNKKELGAIDFINKHKNNDKFAFCKDIETLDIKLPIEVETAFKGLIEVL